MTQTATDQLANVPLPAGAVKVDDWYVTNTADAARYFTGTSRVVEREHRDIVITHRRHAVPGWRGFWTINVGC